MGCGKKSTDCGQKLFTIQVDWMVDIYPKGVWLQKCFAIFTSGAMKEVPDRVLRYDFNLLYKMDVQ